ncbi:MAG: 50S ribosomal protein L11 methyltransferase [Gaiellaceae bacterium]
MSVPRGRAEEARAQMLELFPGGFEEIDHADGVELAAYTDSGGEEWFWHTFGSARSEGVPEDWSERWRRFHRPVVVGPLWIGPPWEAPPPGILPVVIEPGRAFGTGAHATTRLCVELLLEVKPTSLVDAGCGSGVLAVAAARLGFAPVTALDRDPAAVEATAQNARANCVAVEVRHVDVVSEALPRAGLTVANIAFEPVCGVEFASPCVITSGYLRSQQPELRGYRHVGRRCEDEWAADLYERG